MPVSTIEIADDRPAGPVRRLVAAALKLALAGAALVLCWRVAAGELSGFDGAAFWSHLRAIPPLAIVLALIATACSYVAISFYDLLAFRAMGVAAPAGRILLSGATATALGQMLGFGLIVGAFTRWRLLRRDNVGRSKAVAGSAFVALGFLSGLSILASIAALMWPGDIARMTGLDPTTAAMAGAACLLTFGSVLLMRRRVNLALFGVRIHLPRAFMNTRRVITQTALAGVDVAFAGLALWLLTPDSAGISLGAMTLAYIGVLALCLMANTPGGVGPLEAGLLFALPHAEAEALMAGVIAFRAVYYIAPGLAAFAYLINRETGGRLAPGMRRRAAPAAPIAALPLEDPRVQTALSLSERAEDQLAHLGDKQFLPSPRGDAFLMYRVSGRALIAIGDPIGPARHDARHENSDMAAMCAHLIAYAAAQRLTPVLYRTGPALAAAARAAGLRVDRLGHEAVIDLRSFTIAGRDRREIRRKVRKATKAGVVICAHDPGAAPLHAYRRICAEWQAARQAQETTFSMGVCDPEYLRQFPIYEASVAGAPVAILSIWRSGDGREWSLDVMRHASDAPDGTMHALIAAACDGARAAGAARFNLCLAPLSGLSPPESLSERAAHAFYRVGERRHRLQGLRRFKAAFRPAWSPRYVARAPGVMGLYGLWATRRLITTGASIPPTCAPPSPKAKPPPVRAIGVLGEAPAEARRVAGARRH